MLKQTLAILLIVTLLGSVVFADGDKNNEKRDSACYHVKVVFDWKEDCPLPDDAKEHFSPIIGCTHKDPYPFLKVGELASPGVESVAETGDPGLLKQEIASLIDYGTCHKLVGPYGPTQSPGYVEFEITVTKKSPHVSFIAMAAPSPDWFAGLLNVDLRKENGKGFKKKGVYKLGMYDAGTEEGDDFTLDNPATYPAEPIGPIVDREIASFGKVYFKRIDRHY